MSAKPPLIIAVLTVSDRAHDGVYRDKSGPAVVDWLRQTLTTPFEARTQVVPDEQDRIEAALIHFCDVERCSLVFTCGGTGSAPRDVTPEATLAVAEREMPGFGERMRALSLAYVPTAILSRQTAVTRGQSLIVNLPGSPNAANQILDGLFAAIPYCIELMEGPIITTDPQRVVAFRPKSAPKLS